MSKDYKRDSKPISLDDFIKILRTIRDAALVVEIEDKQVVRFRINRKEPKEKPVDYR